MLELKYKPKISIKSTPFERKAVLLHRKFIVCSIRFCLKDRVFSVFMSTSKCLVPISTGKGEEAYAKSAMDVGSDLKLPTNTDTEVMMEDSYVSCG